jgi:hypothetical protein
VEVVDRAVPLAELEVGTCLDCAVQVAFTGSDRLFQRVPTPEEGGNSR